MSENKIHHIKLVRNSKTFCNRDELTTENIVENFFLSALYYEITSIKNYRRYFCSDCLQILIKDMDFLGIWRKTAKKFNAAAYACLDTLLDDFTVK